MYFSLSYNNYRLCSRIEFAFCQGINYTVHVHVDAPVLVKAKKRVCACDCKLHPNHTLPPIIPLIRLGENPSCHNTPAVTCWLATAIWLGHNLQCTMNVSQGWSCSGLHVQCWPQVLVCGVSPCVFRHQ